MFTVRFLLLAACFILTACEGNDDDREGLERSRQVWQQRLDELPAGADESRLEQWQRQYGVKLSFDGQGNRYSSANLPDGHFPVKQRRYAFNPCDGYFLYVSVHMDGQKRVAEKELRTLGSCI